MFDDSPAQAAHQHENLAPEFAAIVLEQALRDLERAAIGADVLAEDKGFGTLGEDFAQAEVQGLREREQLRRGGFGTSCLRVLKPTIPSGFSP